MNAVETHALVASVGQSEKIPFRTMRGAGSPSVWSVEVFIGKLHMDFRVAASLGAHMEDTADDRAELVRSLLLEAGRLMEDASPQFALALPDHVTISTRIEDLVQIGSDLQAMAAAARALMRGLSAAGPTL